MHKVSIIIPTRQRAHLLKFAIKSALLQTYNNLEIVVCDNYSQDSTKEVVDSFASDKIVYVRANRPLSMPDNWEFALSKSSGEYVTLLTDDSFLLSDAVEIAVKELEENKLDVVVWDYAAYFSPDWVEPGRKNVLYIPKATSRSYVIDSRASLERLFNSDQRVSTIIPKSLNSLCSRFTIEKAISRQGRFFLPFSPDFSSAASALLNTARYLFINRPLYIDGVTPASIGATGSFNLGESAQNNTKEYNKDLEDIMFLGIPVSPAGIAKSLEQVKKFYPDSCPELNIKNLICVIADRLLKLEVNGVNVANYWKKFDEYVLSQPIGAKIAVLEQKIFSKLKWEVVKIIRHSSFLEYFEILRSMRILRGKDWGFGNIEEAARVLSLMAASKKNG